MKKDITNKYDIKLLVNTFYHQVKTNPVTGPVFTDIAQVDWEHHLPVTVPGLASLVQV